ncbi:DUF296 domain-containing protein [Aurantimonas sp. Leaf443]|uniref:DUF296 domain-containing protein n=1 Tax=Aurantimonas sp. Leaf443 TaxID=1736378 RepID=UPI0006F24F80|nr:DUF296 domain-containing protein [Aurantimonas sp. Leaf443]KQT88361.1 hypothetical protein ASG48_02750 [Aurantimonas sp. Leaf443]
MRSNRQPGPASLPRILAIPCRADRLTLTLPAADTILASVARGLSEHGADSAIVRLRGGTLGRLAYLGPSLSTDGLHAAWYSGPHRPDGPAEIEDLVMVVGLRDGEPFLHGHGVWREASGRRSAGHILPEEARLAGPVEAEALLVSGAVMDQAEDPETRFRLFAPRPREERSAASRGRRAVLCRLKPNGLLHRAIEATAREHGIRHATLHGIGSLIGCTFASGEVMTAPASELLIREGTLTTDASGQSRASVDLAIVDVEGRVFQGEIAHDVDPVCITFELLILEE